MTSLSALSSNMFLSAEKLSQNKKIQKMPYENPAAAATGASQPSLFGVKDTVRLSPEAISKMKFSDMGEKAIEQINAPRLSESTQRTVTAITSRINAIVGEFRGQPDNAETQAKIHEALKEANLLPEQIRLTDPNLVKGLSARERARRELIISQFNQAYNSWKS